MIDIDKYKARLFYLPTTSEIHINEVIKDELRNDYEPISISIDLAHSYQCCILFKKENHKRQTENAIQSKTEKIKQIMNNEDVSL